MDALQLKSQLEKLGQDIDTKIEKANEQSVKAGEIATELKNELKANTDQYAKLAKQLDTIESNQKRSLLGGEYEAKGSFEKMLEESGEYKNFAKTRQGAVSFDTKATLLKPGVGAGSVIQSDVRPGLLLAPLSPLTMRDVVAAGNTSSDSIKNLYEDYYTSNAAFVAEGGVKPEDDFKLKSEDVPVRTLATLIRVSNQMLADIPFISTYIPRRGLAKMETKLNFQMLYGSGVGEDLTGLTLKAKAFAKTPGLKVTAANSYDILVAAMLQVRVAEYRATAVVLNPVDVVNLSLEKTNTGAYLFPQLQAGNKTINGVPVVENTAMTPGEFMVGDFKLGATLYQREDVKIEFFNQDRDNVQKNLTTIRIEQRVALVTEVPAVFSYGTFDAAKLALA